MFLTKELNMKSTIAAIMILTTLSYTSAFGADKKKTEVKKKTMEITKEQRESMAKSHENMATCLRSDKSFDECHKEMMKSCEDSMGKDGCPMMGEMGKKGEMHEMGKGMMHGKSMMEGKEKEGEKEEEKEKTQKK